MEDERRYGYASDDGDKVDSEGKKISANTPHSRS